MIHLHTPTLTNAGQVASALIPSASTSAVPIDLCKQVTAILVTYRSGDTIDSAVESLRQVHGVQRIIIVDNSCDPEVFESLKARLPVEVISNDSNGGFGAGNNIGLNLVETPFALVLNSDAIIEPDGIATLVQKLLDQPRVAIIGPWPRDDFGVRKTMRAGSLLHPRKIKFKPETTFSTQFVLGAAMLMRMSQLREIGFFDPEIFLYHEDTDLSERVIRHGYELQVTTDVIMDHHGGRSSIPSIAIEMMKNQHMGWSALYIHQKYSDNPQKADLNQRLIKKCRLAIWCAWLSRKQAKQFALKHQLIGMELFANGQKPATDPSLFI
ncbi:glycosyltransferase family 2 protein [Planctomicrobium sp. SH527]|uniref:glycosyltransferase family 2 protein n=1 Tax=Planctomicrobium sp. SH527 TaxID=3448123 RepID=UPI003F5C676C